MKIIVIFCLLLTCCFGHAPIDVVIPCTDKDLRTLELCIAGIRKNLDVRRIIVIADHPLSQNAEWFDEKNYPFHKLDLCLEILPELEKARYFLQHFPRIGWIYQQFLKLYAPFVIPDISPNVLIIDADTIFLNPVTFFDAAGNALYNYSSKEHHNPYFSHMARLLPNFTQVHAKHSGVTHHMLFQRAVLEDLFSQIEKVHGVEAWKAIIRCIDMKYLSHASFSEYEIYFNFLFREKYPASLRLLKWANIPFDKSEIPRYQKKGYHYVSCHSHMKPKKPKKS